MIFNIFTKSKIFHIERLTFDYNYAIDLNTLNKKNNNMGLHLKIKSRKKTKKIIPKEIKIIWVNIL